MASAAGAARRGPAGMDQALVRELGDKKIEIPIAGTTHHTQCSL